MPLWIPIIYLAIVWNQIPDTIATHFNASGEADDFGSKNMLIYLLLLLIGGIFLLFKIIPVIDPKKKIALMGDSYQKLQFWVMGLMSALCIFFIYTAVSGGNTNNNLLFSVIGLFYMAIGNYMPTFKPNYFVGVRTPWTLENDTVWRKTHRLGGKMFVISGLLITLSALLLEGEQALVVMLGITILISFILIGYSYLEFRKIDDHS